jgi:hypothetical protein
MAHFDEQLMRTIVLRFGSLDFAFDGPVESPIGIVFSQSQPDALVPGDEVYYRLGLGPGRVGRDMAVTLGANPSQELFRFAMFTTSMLVFGLQEEMLTWEEFKLC